MKIARDIAEADAERRLQSELARARAEVARIVAEEVRIAHEEAAARVARLQIGGPQPPQDINHDVHGDHEKAQEPDDNVE